MAVGWWCLVQVATWEHRLDHRPGVPLACESLAADLVWSRLAFDIEWRERIVVEMRGVLRSASERAIPAWCMRFAPGLEVQAITTGRAPLGRSRMSRSERSYAGSHETWRVEPSRRFEPGETLVVRYRLETDVRDHLAVVDLVPLFDGSSVDRPASRSRSENHLPASIEIDLDFPISAAGTAPGALIRHWCRNDRRILSTRWRLPTPWMNDPTAHSSPGTVRVVEASLEACHYDDAH